MSKNNLLSAADLNPEELENLLEVAASLKGKPHRHLLAGKSLGLLFFERSLRTRVSFEVGMLQLGGNCINIFANQEIYDLEPEEQVVMDGAAEEHVKDAARTLSRYVDVLGIRQISSQGPWERDRQDLLLHSYAEHATVPVINLESVQEHPCQAIADVMTMREQLVSLKQRKLTLTWSNHPDQKSFGATHSILVLAASLGMDITIAHPLGFELDEEVTDTAHDRAEGSGGSIRVTNSLEEAATDADVLYARSWGSAKCWGDPDRESIIKRSLESWRIDSSVMARTRDAIFMHPLPVRRNVVATDNVVDGPRSMIYDQAENRVHVQKALLLQLLS
ncbi:MAG: N-acetylornithine carbamoyltransferase [Planctomycetota bacterium]|nr:N-acetylornithine carbamoyltransferase [Planctomycetota bacterium]